MSAVGISCFQIGVYVNEQRIINEGILHESKKPIAFEMRWVFQLGGEPKKSQVCVNGSACNSTVSASFGC